MRSVVYQSFKGEETANLEDKTDKSEMALPILPFSFLPGLFSRLLKPDRDLALREKLLPVAYLPHLTLYGAVGRDARQAAEMLGLRVISEIRPEDFNATVRGSLGPSLLAEATFGLKNKCPQHSAHKRLSVDQVGWLLVIVFTLLTAWLLLSLESLYVALSFVCGLFFLSVISLRIFALFDVSKPEPALTCTLNDENLPVYSILVPVFREVGVLDQLIGALSRLSYPAHKLDIKIILEDIDISMKRALALRVLPSHFEVIIVPPGKPQTKPRALNYALQFARGSLLTIFDAEDIPEPMQLRKAAETFAYADQDLACLQAELAFYNPNENWLTRQFTIEYATLFKTLLPSLAKSGLPLLLGGTSNHFRISVLRKIGGWDPFNVTEDADLGLRLARSGYQTSTLDSITCEEANIHLGNWLQQRARWLKGFLQTWLVHMRAPRNLIQQIGWDGFWVMNAMTLGIVVSALFHPLLIGLALFDILSGRLVENSVSLATQFLAALNLVVLTCGYSLAIYAGCKSIRLMGLKGWWLTLLTMPIYWVLMTVAGWMAIWQFIARPFHWNKTRHGLSAFQKGRTQT